MNYSRIAKVLVLTTCIVAMVSSTVQATTFSFTALLEGDQEVPPVSNTGFGLAALLLNDVTGAVTVNGSQNDYNGLIGGATAVTLNGPAAPGSNGPVLFSFTLNFPNSNSGSFSGGGTLSAANINDMKNGFTYVNITTTAFPNGEIRGQIGTPAPEPSSIALATIGLCGLLTAARRTRAGKSSKDV